MDSAAKPKTAVPACPEPGAGLQKRRGRGSLERTFPDSIDRLSQARKGSHMLTRRQWLALMPAGLAAAQAPAPFERIDTHVHLNRPSRAIIAGLESSHWRVLSICVSRATGDDPSDLESQIRGNAEMSRESQGRVAWAGSFDPRRWQDGDFAAKTIASLEGQFRDGAIAVKIWKNIGMSIRTKTGAYLQADNPAFQPIYEL